MMIGRFASIRQSLAPATGFKTASGAIGRESRGPAFSATKVLDVLQHAYASFAPLAVLKPIAIFGLVQFWVTVQPD